MAAAVNVPTYDNAGTQPEVLPAAFPNLLVNGASGIAVGMATNMAPHNLVEVISAARHLIAHPDATLEAGDELLFVATTAAEADLEQLLAQALARAEQES